MDNLALLWIMGTSFTSSTPHPPRSASTAGRPGRKTSHRNHPAILMTAGANAYVPVSARFGLRYGIAYKQGSYSVWCQRDWSDEASPCLARMRDQIDHIDFSLITETRIARHDGLDVRLMFGRPGGFRSDAE